MLSRHTVEAEEEEIRRLVRELDDAARVAYYREVERRVRDPDTYATLNWFFVTGLHHFYLRRWVRGLLSLGGFIVGVSLIFTGNWPLGVVLIISISLFEFYELLRSQVIVQDYNNQAMRQALGTLRGGWHS